jgi:SAM-dependent methyltransferase
LEYGVGNGRIALALAKAGHDVTGVDLSQPMLADLEARLARQRPEIRQRIRLRQGDVRSVRLRRRFPLVIAPFNVLLHLYDRADVEQFLARVKTHLEKRGRFVFDVSIPQAVDLARDASRAYRSRPFKHPVSGERTQSAEHFRYDPIRQLLVVYSEYHSEDGTSWVVPLVHRQYHPREIEALLHYNGFTDIQFTRDFTDFPADESTDSMVVTCRAKK